MPHLYGSSLRHKCPMAQLPLLLAVFQDMSSSLPRHLDTEEVNITDKDITSLFPYVGWLLIYLHHPASSDKIIHVLIYLFSFIFSFFHFIWGGWVVWCGVVWCGVVWVGGWGGKGVSYQSLHITLQPLTHCGLMTPYTIIEFGQHWFR